MNLINYGNGPRAYLGLHGWGGGHRTFRPLLNYLPPAATFYAADLPGYGSSPPLPRWEAPLVGEAIAESLKQLAAPVTVIGNCSGAIFALFAAKLVPERIERLILIDPFAFMPWYFNLFIAYKFGRLAYLSTFASPLGRWLTNLSLRPHRTGESNLTASFAEIDHEITYRYLVMLGAIDGIAPFAEIRRPIDLVVGEKTFGAIKQSVPLWQNIWPQARYFALSGAGHLPIVEATRQLSEIIFQAEVTRPITMRQPAEERLCQTS